MYVFPCITSDNNFIDGSFINSLAFCKNNYCTDKKCINHYKELFGKQNSGFYACPCGLVSYLLIQENSSKIIFTSLREKTRYKKKNRKFQNEVAFNLALPEEKIIDLINLSINAVNEKKTLQEKQNTFDSMEHEVKKLNSSIKDNCDSFFNLFNEKQDLYSLSPDEYKMIFDKLKTLYVISSLINLRYTIYDYEKNPNSLITDSPSKIPVHGKFVKCSRVLKNHKGKNSYISFYGECHKYIIAYSSFELIPFLLLENALKYTLDDNEINVDFEEKNNSLVITIKSMSLYCSQNDIPYIFDKGYRGKNAEKYSGNKGNGIGLYFVKLLCDLHNITVKAESDGNIKNVGGIPYSIFSIILTFNDVYDEEEIKNITL